MRHVENLGRIIRGNLGGSRSVTMAAEAGEVHPMEREENKSEVILSLTQALAATEAERKE